VLFKHNEEDDQNNIIRLVRLTDEMKQEMENKKNILSGMANQTAPDFRLTDSTGKQWHLYELRGKIVVLNFWFTSCAPCIQEMPELNKLVEDFKNQKVVFLGLSFNSQTLVDKFLKNRKFEYTILANSKDVDNQYKVNSWPTSMVIDKNGTIKFVTNSSPKIREELKSVIDSLLKS
jgi:peroxiredoxin